MNLIIILLSIGAAQGIIFGILILYKAASKVAHRFLAALLFLLSYRLLVQSLLLLGIGYYDTWYYFMLDLSWIYGALIYFYVKGQVEPTFRLNRKDWVHFLPVIIQIIISVFVRMQNLYWDGTKDSISWLGYWGYVVWMNRPTVYIIASLLILVYALKAEKLLDISDDSIEILPDSLQWLKKIISSFKVYFGILLAILIVDLIFFDDMYSNAYFFFRKYYYYPFFIGLAILTYWLAFEGYNRRGAPVLRTKPKRSNAEQKQLEDIAEKLRILIEEEKIYIDPELSLNSLAELIPTKPYLLTRCLNEILQKKFSDFINEQRLEEVKRLLKEPESENYTLLSLAMDAGFNSKSSFNRAVKKYMGISPKDLKKHL